MRNAGTTNEPSEFMNPCRINRKPLALLAADALDANQARELHAHAQKCEGCREYLAEMRALTTGLQAKAPDRDIEASAVFHQNVLKALRSAAARPQAPSLLESLRCSLVNRRFALPVALAAVAVLVGFLFFWSNSTPPRLAPRDSRMASRAHIPKDVAPTLSSYLIVANQSLDQLDDLITRQATHRLPQASTYTLSGSGNVNGQD